MNTLHNFCVMPNKYTNVHIYILPNAYFVDRKWIQDRQHKPTLISDWTCGRCGR